MKNIYIAANWKMNKTKKEAIDFIKSLNYFNESYNQDHIKQIICPVALHLDTLKHTVNTPKIKLGAQNCSEQNNGAYTGEISTEMLSDLGIDYCIIGHSERRQYYYETDNLIGKKYLKLKNAGITSIICIGENLSQREENKTNEVIETQLKGIFENISLDLNHNFLIAYEPVWAIGTGKTASPEMAQEVHAFIRNWFKQNYSDEIADSIPVLYGGSVKPDNLKELLLQKDIDGGLIGGASLDIISYTQLLNIAGDL